MKQHDFLLGAREAIPIVLGYLPLGVAFGVLAGNVGLSVLQSTMMSVLCFTGAGQYIAIGMIKAGAAIAAVGIANLLVNMRYFLFSTSMVPLFKGKVPIFWSVFLCYGLTDEVYVVSMNRYQDHDPTVPYMAGLTLTSHLGWVSSTFLGVLLGSFLGDTQPFGIQFALPAMYICLLFMMMKNKIDMYVALLSAALCLIIGYVWPASMRNMVNVIMATLLCATVGVWIHERS